MPATRLIAVLVCVLASTTATVSLPAFASAASASSAPGARLVDAGGNAVLGPYQYWADHALVPTAPGAVVLDLASDPCAGSGCYQQPATIFLPPHVAPTLWLTDSRQVPQLQLLLLHELGHRFDYLEMSASDRAAFSRIMHLHSNWEQAPNAPDEQFAEGYMLCAIANTLPQPLEYWSYGYRPTKSQYRAVCSLVRVVAGRYRVHSTLP